MSLVAILTLSGTVNLLGLWWGLPNQPDAWAPDELVPLEIVDGARQGFSGGWFSLYPPLHYYLLALVQLPVLGIVALGWTTLANPATYTLLFVLVRLTSVVMAVGTVTLVYGCGRLLSDRTGALASALMAALVLPFVYYAKVANVDGPFAFWYMLALWFYLRALRDHRRGDYLGLAVAAVCAVTTKDQAFALLLLMPVVLAVAYARRALPPPGHHGSAQRVLVSPHLLPAGVLAAALFVAIENLPFNWPGVAERFRLLPELPRGFADVPNTFSGHVRLLGLGLRHLQFSLGWPFFLLALGGVCTAVIRWRRHPRRLAVLVPPLSYWVFFMMPIRYIFDRYLLPASLTLTLFGGPALSKLAGWRRARPLGPFLAAASVAYTLAYALSVDWLMVSDGRYAAERWMAANVPPGARIAAVGIRAYLPRFRGFDPAYVTEPTVEEVMAVGATYLVLTSAWGEDRFADVPRVQEFFARLRSGRLGYVPVVTFRGRPLWNLISLRGVRTNLDKINPEIFVYRRLEWPDAAAPWR